MSYLQNISNYLPQPIKILSDACSFYEEQMAPLVDKVKNATAPFFQGAKQCAFSLPGAIASSGALFLPTYFCITMVNGSFGCKDSELNPFFSSMADCDMTIHYAVHSAVAAAALFFTRMHSAFTAKTVPFKCYERVLLADRSDSAAQQLLNHYEKAHSTALSIIFPTLGVFAVCQIALAFGAYCSSSFSTYSPLGEKLVLAVPIGLILATMGGCLFKGAEIAATAAAKCFTHLTHN